jgi:hypothetical protein
MENGVNFIGRLKMSGVDMLGLLCAGSVRYGSVMGGHSEQSLTRTEMAGFLAGLSKPAMLMAQAKYMQDESSTIRLFAFVAMWLSGVCNHEQWADCKPDDKRISMLASLALIEVVNPSRCGKCHGVGFKASSVCKSCGGSGFKPLSKLAMAKAMDVPETTFRRVWHGRFVRAVDWIRQFDSEVNRVVSRSVWQGILKTD